MAKRKYADEDLSFPKAGGLLASIVGVIIVVAACIWIQNLVTCLLAFAGAIAGWLVGVVLVPLNPQEKKTFSQVAKVISSFLSGYLLSKLDPLLTALLKIDPSGHAPIAADHVAANALVTFCSFGVALLTVFGARAYWSEPPKQATEPKSEPIIG